MNIQQKIRQLRDFAASQDRAARDYNLTQAAKRRDKVGRKAYKETEDRYNYVSDSKRGQDMFDEFVFEEADQAARDAANSDRIAAFYSMMGGTKAKDRLGQAAVYGSGMSAGAAGLIAIMEALQGAMDNQERRDYPLQ